MVVDLLTRSGSLLFREQPFIEGDFYSPLTGAIGRSLLFREQPFIEGPVTRESLILHHRRGRCSFGSSLSLRVKQGRTLPRSFDRRCSFGSSLSLRVAEMDQVSPHG